MSYLQAVEELQIRSNACISACAGMASPVAEVAALKQCAETLKEYVSREERRYIEEELETGSKRPLERRNKLFQKGFTALSDLDAARKEKPC